ncbi:MAG: hypothetical protein U0903_21010, partial [Planctomycetales bacterium]
EQSFGNVDPSSATMNLVLLGLRGPAANLLWMELDHYKDTKNWSRMLSTTNSIILLQPHFQKVWVFNGWNLAFNVSMEWDDVRDRYYWVKEGAKFFKLGTKRNQRFSELYWYTGDTLGKKIGNSDEKDFFRQFFKKDPDKKFTVNDEDGPDRELNPEGKDNFEVAREWFLQSVDVHKDPKGVKEHIMADALFYGYPARADFDRGVAWLREGVFSQEPWNRGFEYWTGAYGQEPVSLNVPGTNRDITIHLEWKPEDIKNEKGEEAPLFMYWVERYQSMCNYRYWRVRGLAEREQNTVESHKELYEAGQALLKGDTPDAEKKAYSGLEKFEKMTQAHPTLLEDDLTIEDAMIGLLIWREAYKYNHKEDYPAQFPMREVWVKQQPSLMEFERTFLRKFNTNR